MSDKSPQKSKSNDSNQNNNQEKSKPVKDEKVKPSSSSSSLLILSVLLNSVLIIGIAYLVNQNHQNIKVYSDCTDYFRAGYRQNGIYEVQPSVVSDKRFNVYCNMTAGGWTTIFKRDSKSKLDFQHPIETYKHGFGDLNNDHFLGLDSINLLTRDKERELMTIINGTAFRYKNFKVLNEYFHYKLTIEDEIDKFIDGSSMLRLNNTLFSTIDVDYDLAVNSNCSSGWKAGWWFTDCFDHSLCMTCLIMHGNKGVKNLAYAAMLIK